MSDATAKSTEKQHALSAGSDAETVSLRGSGTASDYAAHLLSSLGTRVERVEEEGEPDIHPDLAWAQCGGMQLTGLPDGPPLPAPGPLASCASGALRAFAALGPAALPEGLDAAAFLGERAAIFHLQRQGQHAPGGSCRLMRAADAWIALNLARDEDIQLLPAWLEAERGPGEDPWELVTRCIAHKPAAPLVERARLLGLPAAAAAPPPEQPPPWFRITERGEPLERREGARPLVLDLSSLWAGPLCTHLLALAGARVIKLESTRRPDGARAGPAAFFDLLNAGKECVALDFRAGGDIEALRQLILRADIVVEGSRPRALKQLGIDAEALIHRFPGLSWISLTGYGRAEPEASWVAFGDDAGVAAGLANATGALAAQACGEEARGEESAPLFCGDAIADPLTGLHAALAALASWRAGGGHLIDLNLCDVTAHCLRFPQTEQGRATANRADNGEWEVRAANTRTEALPPQARKARAEAHAHGTDTQRILEELGISRGCGRC